MKKLVLAVILASATNIALAFDYKVVHQAIGCITNEDHSKLTNYVIQKDEVALKKFLTLKLMTGECTVFSAGEPVNVIDTALFSGMIQIRRRGEIKEFWTNFEYVKSVDIPKPVEQQKPIVQPKSVMPPPVTEQPVIPPKISEEKRNALQNCLTLQSGEAIAKCLNKK